MIRTTLFASLIALSASLIACSGSQSADDGLFGKAGTQGMAAESKPLFDGCRYDSIFMDDHTMDLWGDCSNGHMYEYRNYAPGTADHEAYVGEWRERLTDEYRQDANADIELDGEMAKMTLVTWVLEEYPSRSWLIVTQGAFAYSCEFSLYTELGEDYRPKTEAEIEAELKTCEQGIRAIHAVASSAK